ncbi:MAG: hypothetical protein OEZ68_00905 [Gammaproteobacteria bacterium]|nr:hypothetical protein [Gammaproteobacteria bacterium]MDH5799337.1 hypothetical protein [Gammaproteobacteria bacterium]
MSKRLVASVIIVLFAIPAMAKDFSKEWKKITFPNSKYVEYQRQLSVTATHPENSTTSNYPLRLEHNEVLVYEMDDNMGFGVNIRGFGEFTVKKDGNGKAATYTIAIENLRYFDLNGDGYFDSRYDANKQQSEILFNGVYTPVRTGKGTASMTEKVSLDGNTRYLFSETQWVKQ